jgi:hypothetical protein
MLCQTSQLPHCAKTRPFSHAIGLIMRSVVAPREPCPKVCTSTSEALVCQNTQSSLTDVRWAHHLQKQALQQSCLCSCVDGCEVRVKSAAVRTPHHICRR